MASRRAWWQPRKQVDRVTVNPTVVVATGEVNVADKALISLLLGRFGLEVTTMSKDAYRDQARARASVVIVRSAVETTPIIDARPFAFGEITSPNDYLVREHLEDLKACNPRLRKGFVGGVFNWLVDAEGPRGTEIPHDRSLPYNPSRRPVYREALPPVGAEVALRSDVELLEYTGTPLDSYGKGKFCALHAVRVGSVIDAVAETGIGDHIGKLGSVQQDLLLVADVLASQIAGA